jgi:integrase
MRQWVAQRPRRDSSVTGIRVRHNRVARKDGSGAKDPCASTRGERCNCEPTIEAWVYSKRDGKKIRRSFSGRGALAAAKGWRTDASKAVKDKQLRAPSSRTLHDEWNEWYAGAREGRILNKREQPYKPAVLRNYELALRLRVLPVLGNQKLADIDTADLLDLKEQLLGEGRSGSTIRNSFVPLQAIYRRARRNGHVATNPTTDLALPTSGRRDRAASPAQTRELLDVLAEAEAAIWATAFYAGLRRGEIQALRVQDVDFDAGVIRVERGWDAVEGPIAPKSHAGRRVVFILDALQPFLEPLRGRRSDPDALFFGSSLLTPFEPRNVERKARRAMKAENKKRAEAATETNIKAVLVEWYGLHEARHSFSTFMDHAGISEARADRYMGHAAPGVAGRYRHLLPGQIAEDARRVDEYLAGATAGKVVAIPAAAPAA